MTENSENNKSNLNEEERLKLAKEKFERNLEEFKGIPASMVLGIVSYLATSKARLGAHISMGSFLCISAGYFVQCRREFNRKLEENKELGELMNLIIRYRGTELEGQFQEKYREKLIEMDKKSKYV